MSALGQKQTCAVRKGMSALPPKATSIAAIGMPALCQKRTYPFSGVNTTLNSHQRWKTTSRAAWHCGETTRWAVLRHPRILLGPDGMCPP